jgi:DNA-binding winged helix-turn-helix (wHTH) protein
LIYAFEAYSLDADRRELRRAGQLVRLEPQIFDLLEYLIRSRERVVSKDDLIAAIWHGRIVSESTLSSRINAVRSAIGDNGKDQRLIKTLSRKGVRFVGLVSECRPHPALSSGLLQPILPLPDNPSIAVDISHSDWTLRSLIREWSPARTKTTHRTAIFRQVNVGQITHHDALEFPDGKTVPLTHLSQGQQATVLQLPAVPRPDAGTQKQEPVAIAH